MPVRILATADTLPAHGFVRQEQRSSVGGAGVRREDATEFVVAPASTGAQLARRPGAPMRTGTAFLPMDMVRDIAERARRITEIGSEKSLRSRSQHVYQVATYASDRAASRLDWVSSTLAAGFYRVELEVPARLRLLRWQAKNTLRRLEEVTVNPLAKTHSLARRVLPLILLGATVACSLVSKDGSGSKTLALGPMPELSKPKAAPAKEATNPEAPWHYVLPVDHGVRSDASGKGHFRAPRFHGEHNGIDLLAPVGTPVFSPCEGEAMGGVSRSFGRWVHVICPVPDQFVQKGQPHPWASFFYAHLNTVDLEHDKWVSVQGAQAVGTVGKSGNADGPTIQPHLHLELIVQRNKRTAMDERHVGSDQSSVAAADFFAETLSSECMAPNGFEPKSQLLRRARRVDPFVALTCLGQRKPNFIKAPSPLSESSLAWTSFYVAKNFNVNLGVEDSRVARR